MQTHTIQRSRALPIVLVLVLTGVLPLLLPRPAYAMVPQANPCAVQDRSDEWIPLGNRPAPLSSTTCSDRRLQIGLACDAAFASSFLSAGEAESYLGLLGDAMASLLESEFPLDVQVEFVESWESLPWPAQQSTQTQSLHGALRADPPGPHWDAVHAVLFWSGSATGADYQDAGRACGDALWLAVLSASPEASLAGDLRRALHALGHGLGARHTQDFCPPLDECAPMQMAGGCQERWQCPTPGALEGTLMSACHLCPGGWNNVALQYHPRNREIMQETIQSCLWPAGEVLVEAPPARAPGEAWVLRWQTDWTLAGLPWVDLGQAGLGTQRRVAQEVAPGQYEVVVPPAPCGTQIEATLGLPTAACGTLPWPHGPGSAPLTNTVWESIVAFADDGTVDLGWSAVPGTAMAGYWGRGMPQPDPTWPFAPVSDSNGDGWCFVTDVRQGNSDVDGGSTEWISPWWNVSPGPLALHFDAFFDVVHTNGEDRLVAEVQWDRLDAPWIPVWRLSEPSGPRPDPNRIPQVDPRWQAVTLSPPLWQALRPASAQRMRLRFVARDGWPPSAVEAGIDRVRFEVSGCGD